MTGLHALKKIWCCKKIIKHDVEIVRLALWFFRNAGNAQRRWGEKMKRKSRMEVVMLFFFYRECNLVLRPRSFVEGGHAVFGPEVQVSSSIFQHFDQLHNIVQVGGKCQWAL